MITMDQFIEGLYHYIKSEIIPIMPGYGKLLAGAALLRNSNRLGDLLRGIASGNTLQLLGVIDDGGMIDVDMWANELKRSMSEFCGGKAEIEIPMLAKITFRDSDIDTLRRYLKAEI